MVRPLATGRHAIIAATAMTLLTLHARVEAQSLFNSRGASSQSQNSSMSSTAGSLYGNIGFPQQASSNPRAPGGSFVGRSNQGFVGGRGSSQSSSGGESVNGTRRPTSSGIGGQSAAERTATSAPAERQREGASRGVQRTRIVPRHRIAFDFPARQATAIDVELTAQLAKLAVRNPDFAHVDVRVGAAGIVSLQGRVPSNASRKLAELIVGLEPGVRAVQNELIVDDGRD